MAPLNKRIMLVNDPNGPAAVTSPTFLTLKNLVFRGNGEVPDSYPIWYENDGGGFILDGLDFTATDCVFTDFTVEAGCCGDGGVIVAYNS